jgi:hypothetical protein
LYVFILELASQLVAAENKCNLLEKQLEYMRNMIKHAEMERTSVLEKQVRHLSDEIKNGDRGLMALLLYCKFLASVE